MISIEDQSSSSQVLDDQSINDFYEERDPIRNIIVDSMQTNTMSEDVEIAQWHAKVFGYTPDLDQNFFLKERKKKIQFLLKNLGSLLSQNTTSYRYRSLTQELMQVEIKIKMNESKPRQKSSLKGLFLDKKTSVEKSRIELIKSRQFEKKMAKIQTNFDTQEMLKT